MTGKEMQNEMANFVNTMGNNHKEEFIKAMAREHRTLQQSFTRLCLMWIQELSEMEYYDGRNAQSVELAKKIRKHLEEEYHTKLEDLSTLLSLI